jgi:hypothetical protein
VPPQSTFPQLPFEKIQPPVHPPPPANTGETGTRIVDKTINAVPVDAQIHDRKPQGNNRANILPSSIGCDQGKKGLTTQQKTIQAFD